MTLVSHKLYVFGGRRVESSALLNSLWCLNLGTLVWEKLWPKESSRSESSPLPRYFHSAIAWGAKLVIFGGEGESEKPEIDQCFKMLDDLAIFDTEEEKWELAKLKVAGGVRRPAARYAHLSAIVSYTFTSPDSVPIASSASPPSISSTTTVSSPSILAIIGGQDVHNHYLHSIAFLDLASMTWIAWQRYDSSCGAYRSVAFSARASFVPTRHNLDEAAPLGTNDSQMIHLSHSIPPSEPGEPLFVYTNCDFA